MKKKIFCIILSAFLFVGVPVKGYAATLSPLVFGMSEDVVLAFLASLLGVSAKETINTYADLTAYDDDLRLGFTEYIAGSATALQVAEWIQNAAVGNIDKSSIVWQKFYEFCISQYIAYEGGMGSVGSNILDVPSFQYYDVSSARIYYASGYTSSSFSGYEKVFSYGTPPNANNIAGVKLIGASSTIVSGANTYTYDGKTVYYTVITGMGPNIQADPTPIIDNALYNYSGSDAIAWSMIYEGVSSVVSTGTVSSAFNGVLSSAEKENIFDGTSVLQLYNPAEAQNGLQIVPDPEDPNDIVVPAMLTADWYNFLQQFGPSGASQFVAAYNALNAVQGVSTGAIDAMYNNLGIASAISSASQAAQGTLTLSDNNVFPQASTIADAVNGVIPGVLTPQAPDSGIDNDSDQGLYKLPDLKDFFPFCIPFDLIDLLSCFIAEPETPQFVIALSTGEDTVTGQMDLHIWDNIASVLRGLELIGFTVGLILITRNIIRG